METLSFRVVEQIYYSKKEPFMGLIVPVHLSWSGEGYPKSPCPFPCFFVECKEMRRARYLQKS